MSRKEEIEEILRNNEYTTTLNPERIEYNIQRRKDLQEELDLLNGK